MNDVVRAAAARHPELTVVDWNLYSRSHPDWFQHDGLHLTDVGAIAHGNARAQRARRSRARRGSGRTASLPIATRTLPPARVGRPYLARLTAAGGTRPVSWTRDGGQRFRAACGSGPTDG